MENIPILLEGGSIRRPKVTAFCSPSEARRIQSATNLRHLTLLGSSKQGWADFVVKSVFLWEVVQLECRLCEGDGLLDGKGCDDKLSFLSSLSPFP